MVFRYLFVVFLIVEAWSSPDGDATEKLKIRRLTPERREYDKGHRSLTVIAGNTLSIYCNITGANASDVEVKWYKDEQLITFDDPKIHKYNDSYFDYPEAEAKHRGLYKCLATRRSNKEETSSHEFYVRVKDKLVPLWPFLGICAEVAVLCIIIVIYEKRRNKSELEESDTDGSPDQ